jgi:hypothetical protein
VAVASWLSLLPAVAALAAWPLSYRHGGFFIVHRVGSWDHPPYAWRTAQLDLGCGGLGLRLIDVADSADRPGSTGDFWVWRPHPAGPTYPDLSAPGCPQVDWRGFQGGWDAGQPPVYPGWMAWLTAPLWAWASAFGLLPCWRALVRYRRRRRQAGPAFEVVRRAGRTGGSGGPASATTGEAGE